VHVERLSDYLWRIPPDAKPGMRVPGLVYADDALMAAIRRDGSLEQVANAATLPGIVKASLAMPDIHQGYGLPVGGVVATDAALATKPTARVAARIKVLAVGRERKNQAIVALAVRTSPSAVTRSVFVSVANLDLEVTAQAVQPGDALLVDEVIVRQG